MITSLRVPLSSVWDAVVSCAVLQHLDHLVSCAGSPLRASVQYRSARSDQTPASSQYTLDTPTKRLVPTNKSAIRPCVSSSSTSTLCCDQRLCDGNMGCARVASMNAVVCQKWHPRCDGGRETTTALSGFRGGRQRCFPASEPQRSVDNVDGRGLVWQVERLIPDWKCTSSGGVSSSRSSVGVL